eukprot:GEMP01013871.1.p1 GENE.GEMP01013871.1~~GEMP01013871.1.p1  ORF type:complete len:479 (+),score=80.97 GEMP01013871.1:96-1532(+)
MHKYRLISKKGEGTFSEVLKAQSIKSGRYTAIKCMKNTFESIEQVNNLREIQALRRLAGHPNIIRLLEVLYDEPTGRLALVFELMDMNLYELIRGRRHYLPEDKVRLYMYSLMKALDHMHRNGIFHRDVKPENLLLAEDTMKLADLGSCRGIYSRQPYTEYISTRWYRAPECLLTDGYYSYKMDMFAAGCVWFEVMALFPLFPGQNEMDQLVKIHNVLGTPSADLITRKFKTNGTHNPSDFDDQFLKGTGLERLVPHASAEFFDLLYKLLKYDPDERILARQALKDQYFRELRDAEKRQEQDGFDQSNCESNLKRGGLDEQPRRNLQDEGMAPEEDIPPVASSAMVRGEVTDSLGSLGSQSGRLADDMRGKLPPIGLNVKKEKTNIGFPDLTSVRKREEKKKGAASFRTAGHATLRSHAVSSSTGAPLLDKSRMNQTLQSNTWTKKTPAVDGQTSFTTTWTRKYVSPYTQRNPRNPKR